MSAMVSPSTRTSATEEPSAVTIVPLRISVRMLPPRTRTGHGSRGRSAAHGRNDVPPVQLELLLLVAVHQVQVELIDAGPLELAEPDEVVLGGADEAEPVDDLVGHERGVVAAD